MLLLAIDPGSAESAYCLMDGYIPRQFGKVDNDVLLGMILGTCESGWGMINAAAIEMVASYGMPVGAEVFDTCVWIGRFAQAIIQATGITPERIYRIEEKLALCHDSKAKDSNIRQALIDRFAMKDRKNGKGTKKDPDFFYGFSKDVWQSYSVGITYLDKRGEQYKCQDIKK